MFFTLMWVICLTLFSPISVFAQDNNPGSNDIIIVDSLIFDKSELFIDNVKVGEYSYLFENTHTLQVFGRNLKFRELQYDESGQLQYAVIYLFCYSQNWGSKGQIFKATYRVVKR